jgi:hypothetical protein
VKKSMEGTSWGSRFRSALIGAIISGLIVELTLLLLSNLGVGDAANTVLGQAQAGLQKLTPWSLAIEYAKWVSEWSKDTILTTEPLLTPVLALFMLLAYPIYLMFTEPWAAAFVDVIQVIAGAAAAICCLRSKPVQRFLPFGDDGVFTVMLILSGFIVFVFLCITTLSLGVLLLIFGVAKVIVNLVPAQHSVAITYSSLVVRSSLRSNSSSHIATTTVLPSLLTADRLK